MITSSVIGDNEKVVRILHRDWVVDGVVMINAFTLRQNETYLSVNRTAIESYVSDISVFCNKHVSFRISDNSSSVRLAGLIVKDVRNITISLGRQKVDLSVEVEPRSSHYQSHAGIFTRMSGQNIKGGQQQDISIDDHTTVPVMAILQKVQHRLLALSALEQYTIDD